jgi:prepilin peptidase CpaA
MRWAKASAYDLVPLMDSSLIATAAAALPVLLVWAAAVDILTRAIPNSVVLLLTGAFGLFAGTAGMTAAHIMDHAVCAGAVLTFGFLLFSRSLLGGGDAKLLAAASLWFGFETLLPFLAATALAGGVLSLGCLAFSAARVRLGQGTVIARDIPYGAAIAAGGLAVLPDWLAAF